MALLHTFDHRRKQLLTVYIVRILGLFSVLMITLLHRDDAGRKSHGEKQRLKRNKNSAFSLEYTIQSERHLLVYFQNKESSDLTSLVKS